MAWYFQRTGSCRVWVRALRQKRSRPRPSSVAPVPASSNRRLPASSDAVVVNTRASATAMEAAPTLASSGAAWAWSTKWPARRSSAWAARSRTATSPTWRMVSGSSLARSTPASIQGRDCSRTKGSVACMAPCPIPRSMAACSSCANGPMVVGRSNEARKGTTQAGSTATASNDTEPLPVTRWPKPSQSSTMATPSARRGMKASSVTSRPSCCALTRVGIQCANSAPVQ